MQKVKQLHSTVLDFIYEKAEIDKGVLRSLIGMLPDFQIQERFIYALAGVLNPVRMLENIARTSLVEKSNEYRDCSECVLSGDYNYLDDRVPYRYTLSEYRKFPTEEAAKKFEENGNYDYRNSSGGKTPTDDYPYIGKYTRTISNTTSYDNWMQCTVIEEGRE